MGITEEIKKAIQSKLLIRYRTGDGQDEKIITCVICSRKFTLSGPLCLYIKAEGHVCELCGERFAPEMARVITEYKEKEALQSDHIRAAEGDLLSSDDWQVIRENLDALLKITVDLARGISRGIIEAPAGHIGLLYLAKDITRPARKPDESEDDYQLRIKSYRIAKLFEKVKKETSGRIQLLQDYLIRLGLPDNTPKE